MWRSKPCVSPSLCRSLLLTPRYCLLHSILTANVCTFAGHGQTPSVITQRLRLSSFGDWGCADLPAGHWCKDEALGLHQHHLHLLCLCTACCLYPMKRLPAEGVDAGGQPRPRPQPRPKGSAIRCMGLCGHRWALQRVCPQGNDCSLLEAEQEAAGTNSGVSCFTGTSARPGPEQDPQAVERCNLRLTAPQPATLQRGKLIYLLCAFSTCAYSRLGCCAGIKVIDVLAYYIKTSIAVFCR